MTRKTLSQYLERVMRQKNLKPKDVAVRCKITESYVGKLLRGEVTNLTVKTIAGLSKGLELDPFEVFAAAYGTPLQEGKGIDALMMADTIQKLLMQPELIDAVQTLARIQGVGRQEALQTVKFFGKETPKAQRKPRRKE